MIDAKIAKAKALIAERERIDRELLDLFGETGLPRRGRPRKYRMVSTSVTRTIGTSETHPVIRSEPQAEE
jgi:hypothetical protein